MAGYVMGIQLDIAKVKSVIWNVLDKHGDDADIRADLIEVGRLIDGINHNATNQREIIRQNGVTLDEATIAQAITQLKTILGKLKGEET